MSGETEKQVSGWTVDTLKEHLEARITAVENTAIGKDLSVADRFKHQDEITKLIKAAADEAAKKAELTQHAHNIAANEWRKTVQDFKDATTTRTEFDRLAADFAAYKLEIATTVAAKQISEAGRREGSQENKGETKASIGMIVSIAVAAAAIVSLVLGWLHTAPNSQQSQVPPGYVLVPAQPPQPATR